MGACTHLVVSKRSSALIGHPSPLINGVAARVPGWRLSACFTQLQLSLSISMTAETDRLEDEFLRPKLRLRHAAE